MPAHTFIASALAVAHVGATPVLCDVDEGTGLIDPDAARALVGPRTAAILAVHLYGQACDIDAIDAFARPHGLLVLEDAAQAHGARFDGRRGRLARSRGRVLLLSEQEPRSARRRRRRLHRRRGARRTRAPAAQPRPASKGEHVELGYNERLDGLQAALLRVKLPHLDALERRPARSTRSRYRELLPDEPDAARRSAPESPCIYHLFPVRVADRDARRGGAGPSRDRHRRPLLARGPRASGVGGVIAPRHGDVPRAEAWAATELSLPMHPDLEPREIERVVDAVRRRRRLETERRC